MWVWELNSGPLVRQSELFTAELSFQPPSVAFLRMTGEMFGGPRKKTRITVAAARV